MRTTPPLLAACAAALILWLSPLAARADGGAWLWFEYRLSVVPESGQLPRLSLRILSDTRLLASAGGLAQQFLRVGPLLDVTPWFFVAVHGTIIANYNPGGAFAQEARFEVEPNFVLQRWGFTLSDRNRFEYRWREAGAILRYRNQLRLSYAIKGGPWAPFVWNEWLFDFPLEPGPPAGYVQNRLVIGLSRTLRGYMRLEAGYMLRSRVASDEPTGWAHDHIGLVYLLVGWPPPAAPRPPDAPGAPGAGAAQPMAR